MSNQQRIKIAPGLEISRLVNGMWQTAGGHGVIDANAAISDMIDYHNVGLNTWDMADIYGPAEKFYGNFRSKLNSSEIKNSIAFTKFVPNPGPMTRSIVEHYIDQSIKRMGVEIIDLLQFHWWDYNDSSYLDALHNLENLRDEGMIRHVGLTNFDTERMQIMIDDGITIVSNQVQYSLLDQRPSVKMESFCKKHGIKILCYGTLLGGFFSEKYLNKSEPTRADLDTSSLQKYYNMISAWGDWELFQELLSALNEVAKKHQSSIANVVTRLILDKPQVGGVIIGARLGISEHREDNLKVFDLELDSQDHDKIQSIMSKANDLFSVIGDCGDEYR